MKLSAGCLAVALLSGCSTGSLLDSDTPTPTNYVLAAAPPASSATSSPASQADVAIAHPDVAPGLDTRRIAVLRGRQLDYYRGAEWGAGVGEVLQTLLVSSLQDQQLFRSVTAEQARVSSDYLLDVEVRDFQAEYAASAVIPQVRVTMVSRLIRVANRETIATIHASALRSATQNRLGEVAAAFEAAAQQVALELASKTATAVATDREKAPTAAARSVD